MTIEEEKSMKETKGKGEGGQWRRLMENEEDNGEGQ